MFKRKTIAIDIDDIT